MQACYYRTTKKACAQRVPKISTREPGDTLMHRPEDIRDRARRYSMPLPGDTVCEARSYLSDCELDPT